MVFQHFMLADNLTVLENVVARRARTCSASATGPAPRSPGSPTPTASASTPTTLVEDLGVGERQRVEILKVLYRGARIIILDEPTAVLVPAGGGLAVRQPARAARLGPHHLVHLPQARRGARHRRRHHRHAPRHHGGGGRPARPPPSASSPS